MTYLILQHPGHNRVYYNLAGKLALAELKLATQKISVKSKEVSVFEMEGVRYLSLEADKQLSDEDLHVISRLSFVFAIYLLEDVSGKKYMVPVNKTDYEYIDNKISSILKYQGKTNELFTKMMVNVALLSSDFDYSEDIQLLDPVAGKGTTLFEASVYGFGAFGIEIEPKPVQEAIVFFKKYLETERLKHTLNKRQIYGTGKTDAAFMQEFKYANSKEDFKSQDSIKQLGIICGNSKDSFKYFKKPMLHLIVGDLPYGIFHGNKGDAQKTSKTRSPKEFLSESLAEWHKVLKVGGSIVVAWNSFIVSRYQLSKIFTENGLEVLSQSPYDEFEHMVDKSIKRDIVVARKINKI